MYLPSLHLQLSINGSTLLLSVAACQMYFLCAIVCT